ncbi:MAG: hypothetical protein OXH19_04925 [Chloroflexi bacterium]|nr:hypothetical protein [Chloroflexota bacterium]MCY3588512.1 hypothetical protein [Chloroflexota bacterium]MCY3685790.1 hypothetical protein [Chloroflexota bacterium]MDE2709224.1 hypothetical protein [Chloroflexota bacterium]
MPTGDAPRGLRDLRGLGKVLRLAVAVSMAAAGLWLLAAGLVAGVQAQSQSDSSQSPDHYYYQFYGYARDVTIDGEALQPGDSITPILNGDAVKPAQVQDNGFFVTFRHDVSKPAIGDCKVAYLVRSQRQANPVQSDEFTYQKGCGDIQVRLSLSSAETASSDDPPAPAQQTGQLEADEQDQADDLMEEQSAQSGAPQEDEAESDDEMMQEEPERDELDDAADAADGQAAPEPLRPNAPRTGSGGLDTEHTGTNWSLVVATVALLGVMVTSVLVLMRRRRDQSSQ